MKSTFPKALKSYVIFLLLHSLVGGMKKISERNISLDPPSLSVEESRSRFIPAEYACDACRAVVHQLYKRFEAFNAQHKSLQGRLSEGQVIQLVEEACSFDTYQDYGLKDVKGEKRLSGDGLDAAKMPGAVAAGGMWPGRLSQLCSLIVEEEDEEEGDGEARIYAAYREAADDMFVLQRHVCYGPGWKGSCETRKFGGVGREL